MPEPTEHERGVTWSQHTLGLSMVFISNAIFSLTLFTIRVTNQAELFRHQEAVIEAHARDRQAARDAKEDDRKDTLETK